MTLIELIVYCAIFGYLTYAVYQLLNGTHRYLAQADASVVVQQSAYTVMRRLVVELSESNYTLVVPRPAASPAPSPTPTPAAVETDFIIFPSPRSDRTSARSLDASNGLPNYQQWVCYYIEADSSDPSKKSFRRRTIAISPPLNFTSSLSAPGGGTLAGFLAVTGADVNPSTRVGVDAERLVVTPGPGDGYTLTVSCRKTAFDKVYQYSVTNFLSTHN